MVVRTRLRSIVLPIVFYLLLGVASGYLVWGASNGEHGLKAEVEDDAEAETLEAELADLKEERARWQRRVSALSPETVDRDLLDEEAHAELDRVARDQVVIFLAEPAGRANWYARNRLCRCFIDGSCELAGIGGRIGGAPAVAMIGAVSMIPTMAAAG